jgi:hypothetical protein
MTHQEAYRRFDEVRDEYHAARFALRRGLQVFQNDPAVFEVGSRDQVTLHHLESCIGNLQITYLVRLFAEFEAILRDYWLNGRNRASTPRMVDLMNSVAAYCFMSNDDVQNAHEVRDYRNDVIHEHLQDPRFDFQTCRSRLACFIRWLPQRW